MLHLATPIQFVKSIGDRIALILTIMLSCLGFQASMPQIIFRYSRLLLIIAALLTSGLSAYGDESGTLILVAHTKDAVILSVDSKVTSEYGPNELAEFEQRFGLDTRSRIAQNITISRKLVHVGHYSSCAIAGFLGYPYEKFDVASAIRQYAMEHPQMEADDAMDSMLMVASKIWNTMYPKGSLQQRRPNDPITSIWCGTILSGKTTIVHGQTYLGSSYKALWRKLPEDSPSGIYLAGELQTDEFMRFLVNPNYRNEQDDSQNQLLSRVYRGVVDDLSSKTEMSETLAEWKAQAQSTTLNTDALDQNLTKLSLVEIKQLFTFLFLSVTKRSDHVGPPYNVRLILPCSRIKTTVDVKEWPSCDRVTRHK